MAFQNLRVGSKGPQVVELQKALQLLGYLPKTMASGKDAADGDFGAMTQAAVMGWEKMSQRTAEGIVDQDEFVYFTGVIEALAPGGNGVPPRLPRSAEYDSEKVAAPTGLPKVPHGQAALEALFGKPYGDPADPEGTGWWRKWGEKVTVPSVFSFNKSDSMWVNKYIAPVVKKTFEDIAAAGLAAEVKTFDGCFKVRAVRGYEKANPPRYSTHTFGMAIDINAAENGLGAVPKLSKELVACFKENGWVWGGDFKRLDGMHFQYITGL